MGGHCYEQHLDNTVLGSFAPHLYSLRSPTLFPIGHLILFDYERGLALPADVFERALRIAVLAGAFLSALSAVIVIPYSCGWIRFLPGLCGYLGGAPIPFVEVDATFPLRSFAIYDVSIISFIFNSIIWIAPFFLTLRSINTAIYVGRLATLRSLSMFVGLLLSPVLCWLAAALLTLLGIPLPFTLDAYVLFLTTIGSRLLLALIPLEASVNLGAAFVMIVYLT